MFAEKYGKSIDFLLDKANPSIRLRVKKEILKNISADEEEKLQADILNEKIIRFMMSKQRECIDIMMKYVNGHRQSHHW